MKKRLFFLLILVLIVAIGAGWGYFNKRRVLNEPANSGARITNEADVTGYTMVTANDPKSIVVRNMQLARVPAGLQLSFELASITGVNNYPSLIVTLINRDGSQRQVKLSPTAYAHPDGKLTKVTILTTIPMTGNEANVSIEAAYP